MKTTVQIAGILVIVLLGGCDPSGKKSERTAESNNLEAGRRAIERYGCASCHTIPGTYGAQGLVGPSLEHFASRNYIGGVLENSPANLILWIQDAPAVNPRTAMPKLDLPVRDARDIASFLYSLR
jgi:cytochrome c